MRKQKHGVPHTPSAVGQALRAAGCARPRLRKSECLACHLVDTTSKTAGGLAPVPSAHLTTVHLKEGRREADPSGKITQP
ncbi:hypothetical protein P7K49_014164, partial [Saguinus oedipus]